jgi:hypothetical protein
MSLFSARSLWHRKQRWRKEPVALGAGGAAGDHGEDEDGVLGLWRVALLTIWGLMQLLSGVSRSTLRPAMKGMDVILVSSR